MAVFFFFQAEDGIRDVAVTGVQTCALPIWCPSGMRTMARATSMPATPPANWAPVYQIASARATMPRRWNARVSAGLKCAPERLPQGEYTRAIAVRPMADPMSEIGRAHV